jgi:Tol biopolymer transport system component
MQPRFSPDGKHVAFTSDRTGKSKRAGDNIWIIALSDQKLTQVTDETYRLLSGPSWSPDGQYIVARKHFSRVDDRSVLARCGRIIVTASR